MKLIPLFLFILCINTNAKGYAQKISISEINVPITDVFKEIQKQTGYTFVYTESILSKAKKITVNITDGTIEQVLDMCFENQPISYTILNKIIVLKEKDAISGTQPAPPSAITGKVTDQNGKPLAGVSITASGGIGTKTDDNGNFTITANKDAELTFSIVGFKTIKVKVNGRTDIAVTMEKEEVKLNEVVVIGYGSQSKRNITSAIATVDTKDISSRPIVSAVEAITGKAPGVQVSVPGGTPGGDLSVRIRGMGSPNGGEPLYVVDGVLANDIKSLDPNSIESISILKDASAAGIYGAAGSTNGVVMITTKHGSKGKDGKIEASIYTGMQQIVKKIAVLNNTQWLALETEIQGGPVTVPGFNLDSTNNNWQDLIYHTAMQTGANIGVSGGSDKGTYYLGLGYLNQDGIMVGSNFDRYSVKFSVDQNANKWLKIGANLNFNRSNQRNVPAGGPAQKGGAVMSALTTPEWLPIQVFPNGKSSPGVYATNPFTQAENPLSDIFAPDMNKTVQNNLLGDTYAEIKLPYNIKYRSQFNVILNNMLYDYFLDPYNNSYGITNQGIGRENTSQTIRWAWDNTLAWNKKIGFHSLDVVVGTSALDEKLATGSQSGTNFGSNLVQTLNGASKNLSIGSGQYEWGTNSYFGRVMYNYNDRYLLTATLRADGSSRVGYNNRWGTFPAVSGGWRVSKEKFMETINWVQDLKIRAGWGETGNLPPYTVLYPSYTLINSGAAYQYSSSSPTPGFNPTTQFGNPNLKWESAQQTNIGLDAGFFNGRVTLSADYYNKKITNMIFNEQLPLTTGGGTVAVNIPGTDVNKGFELAIGASIVKEKDFDWDVSFNISFDNNLMTGLDSSISYQSDGVNIGGNGTPLNLGIIKNGYPLGTFWGYTTKGVDPATGNFVYSDNPGNLGSALPKYTFGFSNDFRYKSLSLSLLIDGVEGNKIYDETRMEIENLSGFNNESAAVLARWENPGDKTSIPTAIGNAGPNAAAAQLLQDQAASNYIEDGSFVRLRNVTLGYQVESQALKKIGVSGLHFYISAQNLVTITNYKGYYPEVNGFGQGTNNQAASVGQGASILSLGVDNGVYPAAKTYIVGVNIQL